MPNRPRELPSRKVEVALRARIAAGEWQPEEKLPPVSELATEYGVSRSAVTAALRRIEGDGLIEIIPAWGTFRTDQPVTEENAP
jgi:DNA-binding FadR family transcriptional regulator